MRITTTLFLLMFTFNFFSCSNQTIESKKPDTIILIDGIGNDWEKYNLTFNEDMNIVFGALNTDSTLYLMFRFNDQSLAHMLALRGITLWMDKDKQTGINYQDKNLFLFPEDHRGSQRSFRQAYFPNGIFNIVKKDTVIGQTMENFSNLNAKFNLNDGLYCFEFMLPLNDYSPVSVATKNGEVVIGIEIAELDKDIRDQMRAQRSNGEMDGGLSGGMPGGGQRGGRSGRGGQGGGRPSGQQIDFNGKEIWFNIVLKK